MGKFLKDFKDFAMKGNVIDMAVGVVVGGAFGLIVKSLVDDIIMPCIGVLTGGLDFKDMKCIIQAAQIDPATNEVLREAVTLNWGVFVQTIVNFIIIALSIFCAIRAMQNLRRKQEAAPEAPAAPSKEEQLLTEIRDLLKDKK